MSSADSKNKGDWKPEFGIARYQEEPGNADSDSAVETAAIQTKSAGADSKNKGDWKPEFGIARYQALPGNADSEEEPPFTLPLLEREEYGRCLSY